MTSQFFANVYLNGLDHFIKEKLGCRHYLRYMDDFVVFHRDKKFLWEIKQNIIEYLKELHLSIHDGKCRIFTTDHGVPFLGVSISKKHRRLKRENFVRFRRKLRQFQKSYQKGQIDLQVIGQSVRAWIGHAMHADTMQLRRLMFEEVIFKRGKGGLIASGAWWFLHQ